jgi:hypothetical protein
MGVRVVAITEEEGARVEITCEGYSGCRSAFTTKFRSVNPDFAEIAEFVRRVGWIVREDGRILCDGCARYMR